MALQYIAKDQTSTHHLSIRKPMANEPRQDIGGRTLAATERILGNSERHERFTWSSEKAVTSHIYGLRLEQREICPGTLRRRQM